MASFPPFLRSLVYMVACPLFALRDYVVDDARAATATRTALTALE